MQLRSDIQLTSMIQAMQKIIVPAIDTENSLAMEQAQLMIGMLHLMSQQLPVQFQYDCDELQRLLACIDSFSSERADSDIGQAALVAAAQQRDVAAAVLARSKADPAELLQSIRALREAVGEVVTAAAQGGDVALEGAASKAVLRLSKQQLLRERALLKPQAWEVNNPDLPDIGSLLQ